MNGFIADDLGKVAATHGGEAYVGVVGATKCETVFAIVRREETVADVVDNQVFGKGNGAIGALFFAKELADLFQLLGCGARVVEKIEQVVSVQSEAIIGKEVCEKCFDGASECAASR